MKIFNDTIFNRITCGLAAGLVFAVAGLTAGDLRAQETKNSQLVAQDVTGSALSFVQLVINDGFSVLAGNASTDARHGALSAVFDRNFAGADIGRLALGDQWNGAAPAAQARFVDALGDHFAGLIVSSLPDGRFQIFDATDAGLTEQGAPRFDVATVFVGDNVSIRVVWSVVTVDRELKIQDITFGRQSMLASQRDVFAQILARNGGSLEELTAEIAG